MPILGLLVLLIDIALAVHAVKTGRIQPWLWIILFVPIAGGAVYFVVHVWPDLFRSRRKAEVPSVASLEDALAKLDTPKTREELARAYFAANRFEDAARTAIEGLDRREDKRLLFIAAEALVESGDVERALEYTGKLADTHPTYRPSHCGVLTGRALEGLDRLEDARAEYARATSRHPGEEAHCRHAECLMRLGRSDEARAIFASIVERIEEGAPAYLRSEAEWLRRAKKRL
jgi:hypothetical protein